VHERRRLDRYREEHGDALIAFDRPGRTPEEIRDAAVRTHEALLSGAPVIFQGVLFDETEPTRPFVGYVDFFVRQPDGRYRIVVAELARKVKGPALRRPAAYHEQLERRGVPVDGEVELIRGDDTAELRHTDEIRPVFRRRRARMHDISDAHLA